MNERRKFNLEQYRSKPGSKWYLIKLLFYFLCLIFLGWLLIKNVKESKEESENQEIRGISIEDNS